MSDEWLPNLQLNLSRQDFDLLPRHPAYKYEWIDGSAYLSPWPRYYHAQLDLARFRASSEDLARASLRPVQLQDCTALVPLFLGAFTSMQPFSSLPDEQEHRAAESCLRRTFTGGDGPLAIPASFVGIEEDAIAGAILITLLPGGKPTEWDSYRWEETPPTDLWSLGQGQPHLTWIFVNRFAQGTGIGTQLLNEAVRVLLSQGYTTLWTTFMLGNDSSLLWHWRNGFELMPHALSKRQRRRDLL